MSVRRHHLRQRLLQQKTTTKTTPTLRIIPKSNIRKLTEKGKQQQAKKQALVQELRNRRVLKKEEEPSPKKTEVKVEVIKPAPPTPSPPKKVAAKEVELAVTQRPTRKTKEAAAIYMEILGHKLVGEGKRDDDNVSIDSFPELPNVRKTEQRENELKAKAKVCDKVKSRGEIVKTVKKVAVKVEEQPKMITRNKSQQLQNEAVVSKSCDVKVSQSIEGKCTKARSRRIELEAIKTSILKAYDTSSDSDEGPPAPPPPPPAVVAVKKPKGKENAEMIVKIEKLENNFNDSDEEPLAKLTLAKSSSSIKSNVSTLKKEDITTTVATPCKKEKIETKPTEKTKRECTKKSQNYLFLSSDDDEKCFHGFVKTGQKTVKTELVSPHPVVVASADLLRRDVGRRFGKGKVNMSNEQIEKWLKESEMAGGGVDGGMKVEEDEMFNLGVRIPTETTLDVNLLGGINTDGLKSSLLSEKDACATIREVKTEVKEKIQTITSSSLKQITPEKPTILPRPLSNDRKPIFRKEKRVVPNVKAFSANNECSVYAFGEENEDAISTPFRRPMRRPSSTATSRSEDDSCKQEFRMPNKPSQMKSSEDAAVESTETNNSDGDQHFYAPLQPVKQTSPAKTNPDFNQKATLRTKTTPQDHKQMHPPAHTLQKHKSTEKLNVKSAISKTPEVDEAKYKVPSSPSASSSSSAKICGRRQSAKPKTPRAFELLTPVCVTEFPSADGPAQIVEAPTFHPNDKEFQDPIEYIEKIRQTAEQFGICRIVPPSSFKPECKVSDDMRFTAYNQYVHKMLHRWGPNFKELMAIRKYLQTQNITLTHPPWIGGMEIDLPRLYQTVQSLGGLKEVIEKKKWPKVSEIMRIPKSAQDRVTKLDDIYCKYLLPYDTLSPVEREKLFDEVETEWAKRESKSLLNAQANVSNEVASDSESVSDNEAEECIVKGRNMALNAFYRIARNTMSMWFKNSEPTAQEVEQEFWKHVTLKQNHICVHSGSIDSGNWGYGFAVSKNSPFARHAWNLKVFTNNSGSVLRSMGPIMGVTVPTLHVGMVFSACCWYRDPHHLPWIEYLHAGANKIWYAIPDTMSQLFHTKLTQLVPNYCRNKSLWLPSDTAMVPPNLLVENGVSLCRTVQEPGQYVVVFPKAFTCSLSTGYVVSESVYFAPPAWLTTAGRAFDELRNSCESSMFSLDRLVLSIAIDVRSSVEVLKLITPIVQTLCDKENGDRERLKRLGVVASEKIPLPEVVKKKKKLQDDDYECEVCRKNLFVTMVTESQEDGVYCLDHAIEYIVQQKIQSKHCKLLYTYDDAELEGMVGRLKNAIESKSQKKVPGKFAGMPTLLNK